MRQVTNIVATLVAILSIGAVVTAAYGSTGENLVGGRLLGATAISQTTCKFLHREADPATLPSWRNLRNYVIYEDARHDAKMACLAKHMGQRGPRGLTGKTGARGPAGPAGPAGSAAFNYKSIYATGTGKTVTAQCPAGYFVTGGGSHSETAGSYPEGNDAWVVVRDHLSPHVLDVTAICIEATS